MLGPTLPALGSVGLPPAVARSNLGESTLPHGSSRYGSHHAPLGDLSQQQLPVASAMPMSSAAAPASVALPPSGLSLFSHEFPAPTKFAGKGSIKRWLQRMDTWMVMRAIPSHQRAAFGAFSLTGDAEAYFNEHTSGVSLADMSWETFSDILKSAYASPQFS